MDEALDPHGAWRLPNHLELTGDEDLVPLQLSCSANQRLAEALGLAFEFELVDGIQVVDLGSQRCDLGG